MDKALAQYFIPHEAPAALSLFIKICRLRLCPDKFTVGAAKGLLLLIRLSDLYQSNRKQAEEAAGAYRPDGETSMIKAGFADMMARYNAWQNHSLYAAAEGIGEEERRRDRGAFFGSIHGTLSHLLWGDTIWMSRFGECDAPGGNIQASPNYFADWAGLKAARETMDGMIQAWAQALSDSDLEGDLTWDSPALGRKVARPRSLLIVHFFNHQTHHRGQVHAMLTAAGARPEDTDLPYMPHLTD